MLNFGNKLTENIYKINNTNTNYINSTVTAPLLNAMQLLYFIKILLSSMITTMTSIIGILCFIVIYCLMIID